MALTFSRNGVLFLACREALVTVAYEDGAHMSVGFGSNDPNLEPGDTVTFKEAFARLKRDVAARETIVNRAIKVPVSQQQFDALFDLYYQNGNKHDAQGRPGWTHMMSLINAGDFDGAAAYFPECRCNSAGEEKEGLRKRRVMEQGIFLRGDYGDLSSVPFYPGNPHTTPQKRYVIQPGDL
jgi:lysozyme